MNPLLEFLAVLFPRPCPLCRSLVLDEGEAFCPGCLQGFETIRGPVCVRCGIPLPQDTPPDGGLCFGCLSVGSGVRAPLLTSRSVALYSGKIRDAVLRVKFGGQIPVARSLGLYLADRYPLSLQALDFHTILPVPLHLKRLRERTFNQSVLLAGPLARRLGLPLERDAVVRVRHTVPQTAVAEAGRRKNVRDAFVVRRPESIKDRSILLLDDVYTTGATLEELAGCVLAAGAGRVCGLTLARSPPPNRS